MTRCSMPSELSPGRGARTTLYVCRRVPLRRCPRPPHYAPASATNESGVFIGRERHSWGASCIAHAHWQPLPPRSCVLRLRPVGDEALILLSEVFFHLWRHTGSFEVAFPQLAPPGAAFASARRLL